MKILSVIPARAGSKGIPNKNIRIINGKPLIAYCIENALASKYITDVVISTDSEEIKLIAKHYNVKCIDRRSDLCGDAVTLDAVIFDVSKDYECDYVITMQPTSPTLKVNTLDRAIELALKEDTDTLISVVNKPHLAWVEIDGQIVPDYKKRLNRQYLPKRYEETGAFVISKKSVVTEQTRIGSKVNVFEIGEEEAIDIDNFNDLLSAEYTLKHNKIAIVVNGNKEIGLGHISRMLELSDQLYTKPDIYYDSQITDISSFGKVTYSIYSFDDNNMLFSKIKDGNYDIVINDILDTEIDYMKGLRGVTNKIINFEDSGEGSEYADIVINALYSPKYNNGKVYSGSDYYFIPKLFLLYNSIKINDVIKNVFICFGGADPQGYTEKILKIISKPDFVDINFIVVLGKAKRGYQEIISNYSNDNISIFYDVKKMPELMSLCDVAVTSQGRTCYELAALGIPTLAIAQNVREKKHSFVCRENGFLNLGVGSSICSIEEKFKLLMSYDKETRKDIQRKMLMHDLKKGRQRVKSLIDSL